MQISQQYLLDYFESFSLKMGLVNKPKSGAIYVACSGGPDSMFLLWLLVKAGKSPLHVLHFNYNSSNYSYQAQKILEDFCKLYKVQLSVKSEKVSLDTNNFEKKARHLRYSWFHQCLKRGDLLLTGHNLSDSMEWTWMQMLKSSHWRSWLGIPIKNGRIQRPLMGFSRSQIRNLVRLFDIPSIEDPSNQQLNFERNKMRVHYLKELEKDYPSLEKNYVARHNDLAVRYGMHAKIKKQKNNFKLINQKLGGTLMIFENMEDLESHRNTILQIIISHSNKDRGSHRKQLDHLLQAIPKKKEGPMLFSGGVQVFLFDKSILIISEYDMQKYRLWDLDLANILQSIRPKSFFWSFEDGKKPSDFLCQFDLKHKTKHNKPRKRVHPLLPETTKILLELKIPWQIRKLQ